MDTQEQIINRFQLATKWCNQLSGEIQQNRGVYSGSMVPNLTSIAHLCAVDDNGEFYIKYDDLPL